jgi:thiol-disulfide isomerase/thioredoxin
MCLNNGFNAVVCQVVEPVAPGSHFFPEGAYWGYLYYKYNTQTMNFDEKSSWPALLEMAAEQNKMIFVDAYTNWCQPCKMMDSDVFPDEALSAFFEEHFITVKMDMESDRAAPFYADYHVRSYPTFLFLGPDGTVRARYGGVQIAPALLNTGKYFVDPMSTFVGPLEKRFEAGERDKEFIASLVWESMGIGVPHKEAAAILMKTPGPIVMPDEDFEFSWVLAMMDFSLESELGTYLSDHFGDADIFHPYWRILDSVIGKHMREGIKKGQPEVYFNSARAYVEKTVELEFFREVMLKALEELRNELT